MMRYFWIRYFVYILFFSPLMAEEETVDPFVSSLANTQNLLQTSVQSISTISGEWLESEIDFIVKGVEPFVLTRSYSNNYSLGTLGYYWDFNRPHTLIVSHPSGKDKIMKARFHHPSGITTIHRGKESKHHVSILPLSHTRALTNCHSLEMSAKTNLHNTILKLNKRKNECEVITGSGHVTHYILKKKDMMMRDDRHFSPDYERKSNGNLLLFHDQEIVSTSADESLEYGKITFHSRNEKKMKVETSDGKSALYTFHTYDQEIPPVTFCEPPTVQAQRHYLRRVTYTHKPEIEYEYDSFNHMEENPPRMRLKKKQQGKYFQEVSYYQRGKNKVDGIGEIHVGRNDLSYSRIKEIKAPVSHDETPIVTHRFVYSARQKSGGRTEVYDAYMHKTVYAYNSEHRPTSIARYLDNGDMYAKEKFVWDEGDPRIDPADLPFTLPEDLTDMFTETTDNNQVKYLIPHKEILRKLLKPLSLRDSKQAGNLIGKYLKDQEGKIHHALFFVYDAKGNIKKECFYGNLTGTNSTAIELDKYKRPLKNGAECYQKEFTYSNDAFNHLLSEREQNGKTIEYNYDPLTQQVSAKYIKDGDEIKLRQFFFYDPQTAALIKVIKDDGSHLDHTILDQVKERLITTMTLRDQAPIGLPEIIEEKYWNGTQEVLLKRIICKYTMAGEIHYQHYHDANGHHCYSLHWEYDDHGHVTKEVNALGHITTKKYDDNDNLIFEQGPRPQDDTHYCYDCANRLTVVDRQVDGQHFVTQHNYDYRGNRIETIDHFGQKTCFEYDEFNRLVKTKYPSILLAEGEIVQPTLETAYDIDNRPIVIKDLVGQETSLKYNARGKPLSKIHPDGTQELFEYHLDGTLAKSVAPNGTYTLYERDFLGRVLKEEIYDSEHHLLSCQTFTYKGYRLISKVDPEGYTTYYQHDGAGRLVSETFGQSYKTYTYDALGRVAKVVQWFGQNSQDISVHTFHYDFLNQVVQENLEDASGKILQSVFYTYDELGHKTHTRRCTQAGDSCTEVKYQADGQPLLIVDPEGNTTHFTYNYSYCNSLGQLVLQVIKTDAKGRKTISTFDALGRLREVINQDIFGNLLAKQNIFYDAAGKTLKTIDAVIINGTVQRQYVNAWHYHPSGQEDILTEAVGTPEQKTTRIDYNAFSQKEKVIKSNGIQLNYTYDALGRLKTLYSSDGSVSYDYTYNLCHQVTEVRDFKNHTTTTRRYDQMGQLKQEILGNGLGLRYHYDRMGRLSQLELPDRSFVSYHYNAAYLQEVQRYKENKLLYRHQNQQHDLTGSVLQMNLIGKAGSLHYTYDRLRRIRTIQSAHWSQRIPDDGYDNVGRLVKTCLQDAAGTTDAAFSYNDLDHLQSEIGHSTYHYQTDSIHNRLHKNGVPYSLNALNQLKEQGSCQYTYDANGNLFKREKEGKTTHYTYDALDRLISVSSPEGVTTYQYDAFHRRLTKTHQGKFSRYLYQGQNEIGSVNEQGKIQEFRVLGIGIDAEMGAAIAIELQDKIYAPIHDRQGNVTCLVEFATGQVAESYRYSAFGEETILSAQSPSGNPWRFASKRVDPETGWIAFGRRYYDPEIGRWTTPDPASFADGSNLYAYLHHSPLNAYDAYGLIGEAYDQSVEVAVNAPYYSVFSDVDRSDHHSEDRISYISNFCRHATAGIVHGGVNFVTNQLCDLAYFACLIGCHELENDAGSERWHIQAAYSQWQMGKINSFDNWMTDCLCVDPNNSVYQTCRSYTTAGLEVGSLAIGGYGVIKGGLEVAKLPRLGVQAEKMVSKVAVQELKCLKNGIRLNQCSQAAYNLSEQGQNNIRILRNWARSKGWERSYSSFGGPEVFGKKINGSFEWNLKIKPEASLRPGLEIGSNIPRFDARVGKGKYINPFTGEIGGTSIGTHLPLDYPYY